MITKEYLQKRIQELEQQNKETSEAANRQIIVNGGGIAMAKELLEALVPVEKKGEHRIYSADWERTYPKLLPGEKARFWIFDLNGEPRLSAEYDKRIEMRYIGPTNDAFKCSRIYPLLEEDFDTAPSNMKDFWAVPK